MTIEILYSASILIRTVVLLSKANPYPIEYMYIEAKRGKTKV